jgi:hypothetical protein
MQLVFVLKNKLLELLISRMQLLFLMKHKLHELLKLLTLLILLLKLERELHKMEIFKDL